MDKDEVRASNAIVLTYGLFQRSLEVKLPTTWTDEKQRWAESEKRREEERRSQKKKIQVREKVGPGRIVAKQCVLPMICGSGVRRVEK